MYDLPYYKEENEQEIIEFIEKHPFAFINGCDSDNMSVATQVPVFMEEIAGQKVLRGHIMKKTDHHRAFKENQNVLVVFPGPHTYVSGTWYSNPYTPSTWNYMSVHIKGEIRFLDRIELIEVLQQTTLHFEGNNQGSPTIYGNLPSDYTSRLMEAIVAFEIEIKAVDNVFKLSQDRDEESYENIIKQLVQLDENSRNIAEEMKKRKKELFPDKEG